MRDVYKRQIYSRNPVLPPQKIGPRAVVQDSLVTEGCKIYGNVHHSVPVSYTHLDVYKRQA